jgi:hypothetical protein
MQSRASQGLFLIVQLICLGVALWALERQFEVCQRSSDSRDWAGTPGRITSSALRNLSPQLGRSCYVPEICFDYVVTGQSYGSCRATFADSCDRAAAHQLVARYQPGHEVTVRYDPRDPREAVLEPDSWSARMMWFLLAFTAFLFTIIGATARRVILGVPVARMKDGRAAPS